MTNARECTSDYGPFRKGVPVWVRDRAVGFRTATFWRALPCGRLAEVTNDGGVGLETVDLRLLRQRAKGPVEAPDCVALAHLDDANLLDNLCRRYESDEIYTYVSHVLLAVNPHRRLPGSGPPAMQPHLRGLLPGAGAPRAPPHPFALAAAALRGARRGERQAVVVSGESGAGKTATARLVLQLLEAAGRAASPGAAPRGAEGPLLAADRVLESLGHASTERNPNSSRFGKYLRLRPGADGVVAQVETFLLEAGRAAGRAAGERSFHVFHELLSGRDEAEFRHLGLGAEAEHALLGAGTGAGASAAVPGIGARQAGGPGCPGGPGGLGELRGALGELGMASEAEALFRVLAGLLHLGDVLGAVGSVELRGRSLDAAARLLGMDSEVLGRCIRRRRLATRSHGARHEHEEDRTRPQAECVVRSLIVIIYGRLFKHLVERMNAALASCLGKPDPKGAEFGLLDIYGFENLPRNSLEQLLINLANERLQQFFLDQVLAEEQRVHMREGLPYRGIEIGSREAVVRAVSAVLDVLDDRTQLRWSGFPADGPWLSDASLRSVAQGSAGHLHRVQPRGGRVRAHTHASFAFAVAHYAGAVEYEPDGWQERNDAKPLPEVEELLAASDAPLVRDLARSEPAIRHRLRSVSRENRADLDKLLSTLGECKLHFVRCFRPNKQSLPARIDREYLLEQLVACGTVELLQVMHQSYPHRLGLQEVVSRLGPLLPQEVERHSSTRTFVQSLMHAYGVPRDQWALGVTQLFLRAGQLAALEDLHTGARRPDGLAIAAARSTVIRARWRHAVLVVSLIMWLLGDMRRRRAVRRATARRRLRAVLAAALFLARLRQAARRVAARAERVEVSAGVAGGEAGFAAGGKDCSAEDRAEGRAEGRADGRARAGPGEGGPRRRPLPSPARDSLAPSCAPLRPCPAGRGGPAGSPRKRPRAAARAEEEGEEEMPVALLQQPLKRRRL